MRDHYGDLEPAPPAGGGPTLGDAIARVEATQAEGQLSLVWCEKCPEPATGVDGRCDEHAIEQRRRTVPDAITDPWLRYHFAQATGAIDEKR